VDAADRHAIGALAAWFRRQLSEALESGTRREAERVIREAVDAGLPKQAIYDDVIAVAMHQIGAKWEAGEISVAEEHLATSISYGLVALLAELARVEEERRNELVVMSAVEGERHVMGLQMAADVLEGGGFPVLFLGADVPTGTLLEFVEQRAPSVCALSATMPHVRENLSSTVALLEDIFPGVRVLIGGEASRGLAPFGPTTAVVEDVASAVETVDGLVRAAALN
jgi:methanogenic corrinoid protein MtbC1